MKLENCLELAPDISCKCRESFVKGMLKLTLVCTDVFDADHYKKKNHGWLLNTGSKTILNLK